MKSFFKEIFEYHHQTNQRLIGQISENIDKVSERTIPLFSHAINAHQIWNSRILQTAPLGVFEIHSLDKCIELDKENFEHTIKIMDSYEMFFVVSYQDSKGDLYQNTVSDILYHIGNHFTHHRGQLISDLRQNDIAPIRTDYILYKR